MLWCQRQLHKMFWSLKYNFLSDLSWENKSWCYAALCQFHLLAPQWSKIRSEFHLHLPQGSKIWLTSILLHVPLCVLLLPPCPRLSQSQVKSLLFHLEPLLPFVQLLQQTSSRHSLVSPFYDTRWCPWTHLACISLNLPSASVHVMICALLS